MKIKSLLFLFLLGIGNLFAQLPTDYVYKSPQVYEFSGSNYQSIGAVTDTKYEPGTGSFTIMFTMIAKKSAMPSTVQFIAGKGNLGSTNLGWSALLGEGYLGFRIAGSPTSLSNYRAVARIPFPDSYLNQRVYVAATVDRATGKVDLYLNGSNTNAVYTGFGPTSNLINRGASVSDPTKIFNLGQSSASTLRFTGTLEDVTVYNRSLKIDEIRSVVSGMVGMRISGIDNFSFQSDKFLYENLTVTADCASVKFTPSLSNVTATMDGVDMMNDTESLPVALNINEEKTIIINVTDLALNVKTYTFKIKRTTQSLKKVTVFQGGQGGYPTYRIPAIIKAANGDLLAFCEGRSSTTDAGNIDVVMKRSTDNGITWSAVSVVADFKNLLTSDAKTYGSLYGDHTAGNPAPVLDMMDSRYPNGRIFLAFNTDNTGEGAVMSGNGVREVWVTCSTDNGLTWTTPTNITTSVSFPNEPAFNANYTSTEDWRWYAITPGHAIQLKRSKYAGRLLFPCNHSKPSSNYISHNFYTDDHGTTWKLGSDVGNNTNECIAAELSNGNVMINCRNYDGTGKRAVATSSNGGVTWQNLYRDAQLPEPVCQATLLYNENEKMLLFANPATTGSRSNLTIKASFDDGKTWAVKRTVEAADGAYSDLVVQSDSKIGLLYETSAYTLINYAIANNEWILGGERTSASTTFRATSNPISNLVINSNVKNFSFDPSTYNYSLSVNNSTQSITITPTSTTGIIMVNGEIVGSNNPSASINLEVGKEEFINVTVTETDKVPVNYILKVTRETVTGFNQPTERNSLVSCFPNPTERFLNIQASNGKLISCIAAYGMNGQKVNLLRTNNIIDFNNCANGYYLLQISIEGRHYEKTIQLVRNN